MKRTTVLLALLALSVTGVASAQDPYPPGSATRDSLLLRDSMVTDQATATTEQTTATTDDTTLPRTASTTPLIGLLGASMLAAGVLLSRPQRRA